MEQAFQILEEYFHGHQYQFLSTCSIEMDSNIENSTLFWLEKRYKGSQESEASIASCPYQSKVSLYCPKKVTLSRKEKEDCTALEWVSRNNFFSYFHFLTIRYCQNATHRLIQCEELWAFTIGTCTCLRS